ncbi:hypothetical protein BKA63DRAFT_305155 [Paraphoma chrysanthemicola]|nr:hypothetical protein BKA63DRAFT_305155 [Paraphoma chrysanthemicola]
MNKVAQQLSRQPFNLLRVQYSPGYKSLWQNRLIASPLHPLNETQKRKRTERVKDGIWWHATSGPDLSKSSCVRSWARRRLGTAIVEELKARGFHENGTAMRIPNTADGHIAPSKGRLDLKGSLRLHALPPLVPAKFVEVKAEVGKVIDILVQAIKKAANSQEDHAKVDRPPQWNPPSLFKAKKMRKVA